MRNSWFAGAFCALLMTTSAGWAAVVSRTFDVAASDFTPISGSGPTVIPPYVLVNLNFTATFDDAMSFGPTTSGLTINSNTLPFYAQFEYVKDIDTLIVATSPFNDGTVAGFYDTANSFGVGIYQPGSADPTSAGLIYTSPDGTIFSSNATVVLASSAVSAVPLPNSAPMFGAALLALGAVGYGVKRKKAAAAA